MWRIKCGVENVMDTIKTESRGIFCLACFHLRFLELLVICYHTKIVVMECLHDKLASSSTRRNGLFWYRGQYSSCHFFCPEQDCCLFQKNRGSIEENRMSTTNVVRPSELSEDENSKRQNERKLRKTIFHLLWQRKSLLIFGNGEMLPWSSL